MNKRLVSKETVVLRRLGTETRKIGSINWVDKVKKFKHVKAWPFKR